MESYGQRQDLGVFGVKEKAGENCVDIVMGIVRDKIEFVFEPECIFAVLIYMWIPRKSTNTNNRPRLIIQKFTNRYRIQIKTKSY